jgi:hypothetical protein
MRRLSVLCSDISHMPLLTVWRDSGITEMFGIELEIDIAEVAVPGRPVIPKAGRADALLTGRYQSVSGLGDLIGVPAREDLEYLQAGWAALLEADPFPDQRAVVNAFDLDLDAARGVLDPFGPWDRRYLQAASAVRGGVSV